MLITFNEINNILLKYNIQINGAFHIGAHDCEELYFYSQLNILNTNIIWIDAIKSKVEENISKGIQNIYHATISDIDNIDIEFNISNNIQSSSILEFGTHSQEHPSVVYIDKIIQKSTTVDTFFKENNIDCALYDFWNFDIQGAELMALKGSINSIYSAKVIYLEVNEKELYKNCGLVEDIDLFLSQYDFIRVITNMTINGWGDALYIKRPKNYITFKKIGRAGNNLFQYMFCKLICLQTNYQYIPLEELDINEPYITIYENDLEKILSGEVKNTNIICEGFFQKSDYYIPYREQLLDILYTTEEYWIDDSNGNKKYIRDFINTPSHINLGDNDIVMHIRLGDFKHEWHLSNTDILPPSYYINILENWIAPINNIYIICDKIKYEWESLYLNHFNRFNAILIQGTLLEDIAIMRDCPNLIHSNSTLCWFMSFISKTKKIRFIPDTNFYKDQQKLKQINSNDNYQEVSPLLHSEIEIPNTIKKISHIFYINLNKRTDRKEEIENELFKYITPCICDNYERFPAIETAGFGILGCGQSHLAVLKLAKERNYNNVLILEDDFTFIISKEDFKNELNAFFSLNIDYDVCMLSYNIQKYEEYVFPNLYKIIEAQTASGYIVNSHYYDTLIELYESAMIELDRTKMHWVYANDQIWKSLQKKDNWYCFKNRIGIQRDGFSDNSNLYHKNTF
uniref:Methyltransferase FkbM domain-containing protein n=1 Tax=viral metagenome TaxID=1070528 RepID=A0A6C0I0A0_9ZZZZ